jgi:formate hydrogenlyase transcriptional activator
MSSNVAYLEADQCEPRHARSRFGLSTCPDQQVDLGNENFTSTTFEGIVGQSAAVRQVLHLVETVASSDSTVLLLGETGTGKELVARAIHQLSRRNERPLVKLNCAAIPSGLLESELFGHERGAFTGAVAPKTGRLELAHQGTLFLDEVGDIQPELQPKLLRALQEREFERLGSSRTIKVDVRLVAATNCDLNAMVADKRFRSDLYYRLNVFPIRIPPLRERREDIPFLVRHFVEKYARQMGKEITTISASSMRILMQWHWPGNIRELENLIERAVIMTSGTTLAVSTPESQSISAKGSIDIRESEEQDRVVRILGKLLDRALASNENRPVQAAELLPEETASTVPAMARFDEQNAIVRTLRDTNGKVGGPNGAAARMGLKRTTLITRMKKLGIEARRVF